MQLRKELLPPTFDSNVTERLAHLAENIDGATIEESRGWIDEFNHLIGAPYEYYDFQGIWEAMGHDEWVYLLMCDKYIQPVGDVTRDELIELTQRVMNADHEAYLTILEKNVTCSDVTELIFWPSEVEGFPYEEPTAEQVADYLLAYQPAVLKDDELASLLKKSMSDDVTHDEFRLLSDNLPEFEINFLSGWLDNQGIAPEQAIRFIREGKIIPHGKGCIALNQNG